MGFWASFRTAFWRAYHAAERQAEARQAAERELLRVLDEAEGQPPIRPPLLRVEPPVSRRVH